MTTTQNQTTHDCGGTILTEPAHDGYDSHEYCDACGAYAYEGEVPHGTDAAANRAARDAGEERSPEPA